MEQAGAAIRDPLVGTVLDERYRVLRRIGRGGMGIVYLAQHVLIGRKYAIKTLSERANATDEMVARFHREAVAAAAVGSEHVVEVTDMGRLPDGTLYIALEYLEGVELAAAVRAEGPLAVQRAVRIACQLCDALSAVHAKGIVHRDLKPENLFLIENRGTPDFLKVLDFGICKLLDQPESEGEGEQAPLTRTNASLGTPQFMAPEQFQTSARVDQRADIHAVGGILYYMLTGKPPFDAPSLAQLYMRVCVEPVPPLLPQRPDLPSQLDAAIRKAMSKHPGDRFASADALKCALSPFAQGGWDRPSHITPIPSFAALGQPTRAGLEARGSARARSLETKPDRASESVTPRLPERRWRRPLLALSLVASVMGSMAWGAWAVARVENKARVAVGTWPAPAPAPHAAERSAPSLALEQVPPAPRIVADPRPAQARVRVAPFKSRALPVPSAALEAVVPEAVVPEPAQEETVSPKRSETHQQATDATFHFPRRALKSVF